jgi:antagonist of KipI
MQANDGTRANTNAMTVIKAGLFTTVQDMGRPGWRASGVTAGGAMDTYALRAANLLVGNEPAAAGLEMTLMGGKFRVEQSMLIAVTGAYMTPTADGVELPMWRPVWLPRGTTLSFGRAVIGCRAYLAAAGGIDAAPALGARGTDTRAGFGGTHGRPLAAGDALPVGAASPWAASWSTALAERAVPGRLPWAAPGWFALPDAYGGAEPHADGGIALHALPSAAFETFAPEARERFFREPYRVALASDRMGCRLIGPMLERTCRGELVSRGIMPGAVQVPPGGEPIVLAADCQPTGGYPVIAHVATADLPLLAQAKPGDRLRFRRVTLQEAQRLDLEREASLGILAAGLAQRTPAAGFRLAEPGDANTNGTES